MGYYTKFEGKITIDPPLTWREIKGSPYLPEAARKSGTVDVMFRVQTSNEETDDGLIIRSWADAIVPLSDSQYKGYHIIETIEKLIKAFPEHTFSGRFDCEGETQGDIWRLVVRDGRIKRVEPRIIWPEDED